MPEPAAIVCPQCFGANLGRNHGLRRHDANGITHGYICRDCGEAFISHAELRQRPSGLGDGTMNPIAFVRAPAHNAPSAQALTDRERGSGQWLQPRKGKDEGGMLFEVGK